MMPVQFPVYAILFSILHDTANVLNCVTILCNLPKNLRREVLGLGLVFPKKQYSRTPWGLQMFGSFFL
jgi:hypothetical protein